MSHRIRKIGEVLGTEKEFKNFTKKAKEQTVVEKFHEIFPKLKKLAEAKRVENGILFLKVENSVMRSELNINKNKTIEMINKHVGEKIIDDIKFVN